MKTHITTTTIPIRRNHVPATFTLPENLDNVRAGIVYVHGSGSGGENDTAIEARRFASMGIAFLTVRKVMDGYTPAKRDYTLLADDAIDAVEWLRKRPEMDGLPTGLMGISEGGWVTTYATASCPDIIDFLILESAPIISPGEQIRHHRNAESRGLPFLRKMLSRIYTEFIVLVCNYSRFDSRPWLQKITQPIYAVWGSFDHTIPIDRAMRLLANNTHIEPEMVIIEGEPHYLNPDGDWLVDTANWILRPKDS